MFRITDPEFGGKVGTGFAYSRADGSKLSEKDALKRIKALAIPPAWTDVGFVHSPMAISKQPGVTQRVASSIVTTRDFVRFAKAPSTTRRRICRRVAPYS